MKKIFILTAICALTLPAFGAGRSVVATTAAAANGRATVMPASMHGSSIRQDGISGAATQVNNTTGVSVVDPEPQPATNTREAEKNACLANNVGIGNTFVWASRYGNTTNYANMIEDTQYPENNACFVLIGMQSKDSRVNISDIQPRYFVMGETVTCGSWTDEAALEKRILDAKKKGRVWATVGGAVGGAGIGVGAMELFGNKLIGGKVQGQKALEGDELLISQLNVLKKDNPGDYTSIVSALKVVRDECKKITDPAQTNESCKQYNYNAILSALGEQ